LSFDFQTEKQVVAVALASIVESEATVDFDPFTQRRQEQPSNPPQGRVKTKDRGGKVDCGEMLQL